MRKCSSIWQAEVEVTLESRAKGPNGLPKHGEGLRAVRVLGMLQDERIGRTVRPGPVGQRELEDAMSP